MLSDIRHSLFGDFGHNSTLFKGPVGDDSHAGLFVFENNGKILSTRKQWIIA
jgi:hypothetical protein